MSANEPTFALTLRFWHRLGWIGFGGPAGQIAIMHEEIVERRRWVDEHTFLRGLNFCMLLPGPEAMQLATWLGWRLHGVRGGLAAGTLFILPACAILALLSWIYLRFGEVPLVAGALFGIQAAVLGILTAAIVRLATRVLKDAFAIVISLAAFVALVSAQVPFPLVIVVAALVGLGRRKPATASGDQGRLASTRDLRPGTGRRALLIALTLALAWWLPLLSIRVWLGADSTAWAQASFFSQAALVTFGGAYAVLPYVAQQAVEVHGWLDANQMLAGLGLAESTPGPLVIVLEFVGFVGGWQHPDLESPMASALLGAAVTVWATFLPSFLFVLSLAPWVEPISAQPRLNGALVAVSAAVVGVMASLALWFGWHLLRPIAPQAVALALVVAAISAGGLMRFRIRIEAIVGAAALVGLIASPLLRS